MKEILSAFLSVGFIAIPIAGFLILLVIPVRYRRKHRQQEMPPGWPHFEQLKETGDIDDRIPTRNHDLPRSNRMPVDTNRDVSDRRPMR